MSQEEIKADVARKALALCNDRIEGRSGAVLPVLESTRVQLEWLVGFFEGRNNERNKLRDLTFGHYAAREIDERDVEFIKALSNAYYIASRTAAGLKVDMAALNEDA